MMTKRKRDAQLPAYAYEVTPEEAVLWVGKPDPRILFTKYDLLLIPFSIIWCLFVGMFWLSAFSSNRDGFSIGYLIILPHTLIGIYMLIGRFIFKFVGKIHTDYILTNARVIIITSLFGRQSKSLYLSEVSHLELNRMFGQTGSIIFKGQPSRWWRRKQTGQNNTGMGNSEPGFYDIHDVDEVYRLLNLYIVPHNTKVKRKRE